jgi:hypothetical protein
MCCASTQGQAVLPVGAECSPDLFCNTLQHRLVANRGGWDSWGLQTVGAAGAWCVKACRVVQEVECGSLHNFCLLHQSRKRSQ